MRIDPRLLEQIQHGGFSFAKNHRRTEKTGGQPDKKKYWINPGVEQLEKEWLIILNNTITKELLVLRVPAKTFHVLDSAGEGLYVRTDKPNLVNIKLDLETLVEKQSSVDFSPLVEERIRY